MTIEPGANARTGLALHGLEFLLSLELPFSFTKGMGNGSYWRMTDYPWVRSKRRSIHIVWGLSMRQFLGRQIRST